MSLSKKTSTVVLIWGTAGVRTDPPKYCKLHQERGQHPYNDGNTDEKRFSKGNFIQLAMKTDAGDAS